jgi:hypothetical protein
VLARRVEGGIAPLRCRRVHSLKCREGSAGGELTGRHQATANCFVRLADFAPRLRHDQRVVAAPQGREILAGDRLAPRSGFALPNPAQAIQPIERLDDLAGRCGFHGRAVTRDP